MLTSLTDAPLPRRAVVLGAGAIVASAALTGPGFALTEGQAQALISRLVDDVNAVIDSNVSDAAKLQRFEAIFVKYADTEFMARYALGADGRGAPASEIRAFTQAFEGYISRKYGRRFREFIGGRLEVGGVTRRSSVIEVEATVFLRGADPFRVTFQLSDRTGQDRFVNMFIEGVNLLLSERTEIGAMLDQRGGSISRLAQDLRNT